MRSQLEILSSMNCIRKRRVNIKYCLENINLNYQVNFSRLKWNKINRGGSRIFSRRGRIFKKNSKILTSFFFRSTKFLKKQSKKPSPSQSPSNLIYFGATGVFRKILRSVGQKWISEKYQRGGPFGSAGDRFLEKGGRTHPPPPLNPALKINLSEKESHL